MAVYVDDAFIPFGRMLMSHMFADSPSELLQMADTIGVPRHWVQKPGTPREHFDVCKSKRAAALRAGAIMITTRQGAAIINARRHHAAGYYAPHPAQQAYLEAEAPAQTHPGGQPAGAAHPLPVGAVATKGGR